MENQLVWKKGHFSEKYRIYSGDQQIGQLKNRWFSQTADGEINGKSYTFKTKGFFNQHTLILDPDDHEVGSIRYGTWRNKATIILGDQEFSWKHDTIWSTKWSISQSGEQLMQFKESFTKGKIDAKVKNDLLLLSGLYIANYYWQITVIVVAAVMVPILG